MYIDSIPYYVFEHNYYDQKMLEITGCIYMDCVHGHNFH